MKSRYAFNIILFAGLAWLPRGGPCYRLYNFGIAHNAHACGRISHVEFGLTEGEVGQLLGGN